MNLSFLGSLILLSVAAAQDCQRDYQCELDKSCIGNICVRQEEYLCSNGAPELSRWAKLGISCSLLESFMMSVYCEAGHVCQTLGRTRVSCGSGDSSVLQCRKDSPGACPRGFRCNSSIGGDPNFGFCCPSKAQCPGGKGSKSTCESSVDCGLDEECVGDESGMGGVCCALEGPKCSDGAAAIRACSADGRCPDPFTCSPIGLCCLPPPSRADRSDQICAQEGPYHAFGPCPVVGAKGAGLCGPAAASYAKCVSDPRRSNTGLCCAVLCPGGSSPAQPMGAQPLCSAASACPPTTQCSNGLCCPAFLGHQCASDPAKYSVDKCTRDSDCPLDDDCERSSNGVGFCCPSKQRSHKCRVKGEMAVETCSADFDCGKLGEYCEEGFCCSSPDPVCSSGVSSSQKCSSTGRCPSGFVCEKRGSVESPDGVCCAATCPDQSSPAGLCADAVGNSLEGADRYRLRCSGRRSCFIDAGKNPLCCQLHLCPSGRVAQLSCAQSLDCPLDSECQQTSQGYGICCPVDMICSDGTTAKRRCSKDSDCPFDTSCSKNAQGQGICCAYKGKCSDGAISSRRCDVSSDCEMDFECQSGSCCAVKKLCSSGNPSKGNCRLNIDCPLGTECSGGLCCGVSEKAKEEGGEGLCPVGFVKSIHPSPQPQPYPGPVPIQCNSPYDCYKTLDQSRQRVIFLTNMRDRACVGPDPAWRINYCCYRPQLRFRPQTTTRAPPRSWWSGKK